MNIHDVNNPLIGGELAKERQISEKKETERTEKPASRVAAQQQESEVRATQETSSRPAQDTYESTETRRIAAELTRKIETTEPEPREEAVNRARERVQSGYYNTSEFMGRLAVKLINTGVTR